MRSAGWSAWALAVVVAACASPQRIAAGQGDAHYTRAQELMEQAGELVRKCPHAEPDARARLIERAERLYDRARQEAAQAVESFQTVVERGGARAGRQTAMAKGKMLDALLIDAWCSYDLSKAYAGMDDARPMLNEALQKFEGFAEQHPGNDRTLQAYRGAGLCHFRLGQYDRALRAYRRVIRTRPVSETDEVRQLAYFNQAQCYNECGRYEHAIKSVSVMLGAEWPELMGGEDEEGGEPRAPSPIALAAKLEQAKGLVGLAKRSRARAAQLRQQGAAAGAQKEERDAARRFKAAVADAKSIAARPGPWGNEASARLAEWQRLMHGDAPGAADQAFADAERAFKAGRLEAAIPLYKQATDAAVLPGDRDLALQAWLKLGACYMKLGKMVEAARAFGHAPRTFGPSAVKPDAAYISAVLYGQVYQNERTAAAAREYLDALRFFAQSYPNHAEAAKLGAMATQVDQLLNAGQAGRE